MTRFICFFFALSIAATAWADVCANPKSTEDVLVCLEANHPEMQKTANDPLLIEGVRRQSVQFPNPGLTLETNKGKSLGDTVGEDTAVLSQLFEIGGKRNARQRAAQARITSIKASTNLLRAQTRMDSLSNLVRLRQLNTEIEVIQEAIQTYEKVISQFAARPALTPEQQVTQGIFRLALGDFRHRLAGLESDRRRIEIYFKMVSELNFKEAVKFLPPRIAKWPRVQIPPTDIRSVLPVQIADANLQAAEAESDMAKALAIPDPTVSLVAIREVAGPSEFQRVGAAVSLPLPFLNVNGGQKREAAAMKTRAEIEYGRTQRAFAFERENLVANYNGFVSALEKSPSVKDIDSKHKSTETLFYRGVISGVLVIESHRQILDFTQSQNELELETVQALQNIFFLDGKLSEFRYE